MLLLIEGIVMCFVLLMVCVIGIANGPVGLVVFYEDDVQQRVVELGLTTKAKIKKTMVIICIALYAPVLILTPLMVYGINGAVVFWEGFHVRFERIRPYDDYVYYFNNRRPAAALGYKSPVQYKTELGF